MKRLLSLLPAALLAVGCAEPAIEPEAVVPEAVQTEAVQAEPALTLDRRRTTRPDIALRNFEARITSLRQRWTRTPTDYAVRESLVEHLLARATFLGTFDDFDEADRLSADTWTMFGDSRSAMLRAGFLSAVHRFDEARTLLDRASELGGESTRIERSRIGIDVATGVDPAQLERRMLALLEISQRYEYLTTWANVLAANGRYRDADAAYVRALEAYRDVSPFTLAWVSFARGVMWGEMADRPDLAEILYRDAVSRLPSYVVANTHLSELEDAPAAIARLERFADSGDPEPSSRLAERLRPTDPVRAAALVQSADARYQALLSKHRAAFLDHASEFYAGSGDDSAQALALSLDNLTMRPNPRAYVVAIQAAHQHNDTEKLCQLIDQCTDHRRRHPSLNSVVQEHEASCR